MKGIRLKLTRNKAVSAIIKETKLLDENRLHVFLQLKETEIGYDIFNKVLTKSLNLREKILNSDAYKILLITHYSTNRWVAQAMASLIVSLKEIPSDFFYSGWWDKWCWCYEKNVSKVIKEIIKAWMPHQADPADVAASKIDKLKKFVEFISKKDYLYQYISLEHRELIVNALGDHIISHDFLAKHQMASKASLVDAFAKIPLIKILK